MDSYFKSQRLPKKDGARCTQLSMKYGSKWSHYDLIQNGISTHFIQVCNWSTETCLSSNQRIINNDLFRSCQLMPDKHIRKEDIYE